MERPTSVEGQPMENSNPFDDDFALDPDPFADGWVEEPTATDEVKEGDELETTCEDCEKAFTFTVGHCCRSRGKISYLTPTRCPPCSEEHERKREEAERQERLYQRFRSIETHHEYHSDFGQRLSRASFVAFEEGPHNAEALAVAKKWLAIDTPFPGEINCGRLYSAYNAPIKDRPSLIIVGAIGSGKSYLAACLYRELKAKERESALWLNAASLIAQVRHGFSDKEAGSLAGDKIKVAGWAPVLFLDDLGKVHPGKDVSWIEEQFYALIDARYRAALPTVVTTEWKAEALTKRVGESVVSRLMDGAMVAGIKAPAKPYRERQA